MNRFYEGFERNEYWVDHWRFPNHEFSTHGRIRNRKNGHILRPHLDRYGYEVLSIGNVNNVSVHRVICEAFYGALPFPNAQVNHIDCDRQNNHIFNLEWVTPSENIRWCSQQGRLKYQSGLDRAVEVNKVRVRIIETEMVFDSIKDCADYFGVRPTNIQRVLSGSRKGQRFHGIHLEYVDESERRCNRR